MNSLACRVASLTVRLFADARMVLALVALSLGSAGWALVARSELAATLFLSILALAITAAILFDSKVNEERAHRRDEALHRKVDGLVLGAPTVDDALAGIETS